MKKNLLWMLAAILFCGVMTTSCSKDDDDNSTPTPDTPKQETQYDIELNFIAHPKSLQYFEYDFKYVDANGNTKTIHHMFIHSMKMEQASMLERNSLIKQKVIRFQSHMMAVLQHLNQHLKLKIIN